MGGSQAKIPFDDPRVMKSVDRLYLAEPDLVHMYNIFNNYDSEGQGSK